MSKPIVERRRDPRQPVEMPAHLRHRAETITVILKDLTRYGARIEGVVAYTEDEAVDLFLPEMKPILSFVIWANEHCAGIEFAEPLSPDVFSALVHSHGLNRCETDSLASWHSSHPLSPDPGPIPL